MGDKMKPIVFIKAAMSLDGKIATKTGESQWISNEKSRHYVHELRAAYDAICVGVQTVKLDNPRLTIRQNGQESCHYRMILDSKGRIPLNSKVLNDQFKDKTILFTTNLIPITIETELIHMGIKVVKLKVKDDKVDLEDWLIQCETMKIKSIFVEGGAEVIASMLKAKIVDKIAVAIAPIIIGGQSAKGFVSGDGIEHLKDAIQLEKPSIKWFDEDCVLEYTVKRGKQNGNK
jgi:diaminohydroxyphosphoribosylaminopyrimidine deaminase / 5-amino-6-(5-phosphoribosylamino)uracil reductase